MGPIPAEVLETKVQPYNSDPGALISVEIRPSRPRTTPTAQAWAAMKYCLLLVSPCHDWNLFYILRSHRTYCNTYIYIYIYIFILIDRHTLQRY